MGPPDGLPVKRAKVELTTRNELATSGNEEIHFELGMCRAALIYGIRYFAQAKGLCFSVYIMVRARVRASGGWRLHAECV